MTFKQSIVTCFRKYTNTTFTGRASSSEFWRFNRFMWLVSVLCAIVGIAFMALSLYFCLDMLFIKCTPSEYPIRGLLIFFGYFMFLLLLVFLLVMVIPYHAVGARRLHDRGHSGWWQICYYLWILAPSLLWTGIALISFFILIVTLSLPSKPEANQYGEPVE